MVEGTGGELTLDRDDGSGSRRPRALWGALAAIAVLAATLGVVALSGGEGDGSARTLPVALGGAGFGGSEGAATADMSLAAWIHYVAGDGLPSLGGEAPAYRLAGDVGEERVRALAAALGLDGEAVRTPEGTWRVEVDGAVLEVYDDGMAGGWWYQAGGEGTMGFSTGSSGSAGGGWAPHPQGTEECVPGPAVDCAPVGDDECAPGPATDCGFGEDGDAVAPTTSAPPECPAPASCAEHACDDPVLIDCVRPVRGSSEECAVTQAPDGSTTEECVSHGTPVPTDLPSREEARSIALDLLDRLGLEVDDARITVEGPFDAWYVMVEPVLDGVPVSGWVSTVGVGSNGEITSASGTLATAERVGEYPLLDAHAAIERLNTQGAGSGGGAEPMPLPAPDVAVDSGSATAQCNDAVVDCETVTTACVVQPDGLEVCEHPTATAACKVQPDGREVCEVPGTASLDRGQCVETAEPGTDPDGSVSSGCVGMPCPPEPGSSDAPTCPPPPDCGAAAAEPGTDPATTVPPPGCDVARVPILPAPEALEVVLTGAEPVLVLAPAIDGSSDMYLVPGYRFSSDEGHTVDVMAITDEVLGQDSQTDLPRTTEPPLPPPETTQLDPDRAPCDGCEIESSDPDVVHLSEGEPLEIGVPYYVDVDVECAAFELGGLIWRKVDGDLSGWATPHEGGAFTLHSPTQGSFVGDHQGTKTAEFVADQAGDGCLPAPRG